MKTVASNRKAYHNFEVLDKYEAGIVLEGWEVKSIKEGKIDLSGAYVKLNPMKKTAYLVEANVPSWSHGEKKSQQEQSRKRKLLLHASEIRKASSEAKSNKGTVVPLEVYINNQGLLKVEVGVVKSRKMYDKRRKKKERDLQRQVEADRKKYNI
jgi:SsrA-binding protein